MKSVQRFSVAAVIWVALWFLPVAFLRVEAREVTKEWSQWCGRDDRNMIAEATGLPVKFQTVNPAKTNTTRLRNVKWVSRLGAVTYGSPVVAGGKVYVAGAQSGVGGQEALGMLWCLGQSDGKLLWRFRSPFSQYLYNRSWGLTSTPTVEGDRVYLLGHLGEVLCLDAGGLANGNDGPFQDEETLLATERTLTELKLAPDGSRIVEYSPGTPGHLEPTDADIIWRFDMIRDPYCRCWPFNALNAGILIRGDYLYVATCSVFSRGGGDTADESIDPWKKANGQTRYESPSLIVLDKRTGQLVARDDVGAFEGSFHGAHSSPALGIVQGRPLVFWGGGDGVCYAFDANFTPGADGKPGVLRNVWRFNCIDPSTYDSASIAKRPKRQVEIIATPVFYKNRVYVAVGNDLLNSGSSAPQGRLLCIDATGTGDITQTGKVWAFDDIRSSSSTVAIRDGLLFTADARGNVYCLDAETGRQYWTYKTGSVWGSPLVADGKVFVPTHGRGLLVFAAQKKMKLLGKGRGLMEVDGSPAVADNTLYVPTAKYLFAVRLPWLNRVAVPLLAGVGVVGLVTMVLIWRRVRRGAAAIR